ncbi:MAG TPA: GDSL-type esterase/lipase family protein [Puia sp.]|nr:GDSL-type esterase/lipase family protein [Puia sp.]
MNLCFPKIFFSFLLIANAWILIACTKSNASQMPFQTPDTTTVKTDTTTKTYLALGDSYTIGQSVPENDRYPVQTVQMLNDSGIKFHSPEIIATTGWTTANLQDAINNYQFQTSAYDIVTLLIGVNNQYQRRSQSEYKDQFTVLLQKAISLAGNKTSHVIVLSIPDYSVTPFAKGSNTALIASQIDSFNVINKQIATAYNVHYINVTDESRKAASNLSLLASDGLHYSGIEYSIWGGLLFTQIQKILQ